MENYMPWLPKRQPDILGNSESFGNIEWTADEIFENVYDKLQKKYPDYISKKFLGFDSSGKYKMFAYEFVPENFTKTVYIQSGVHCLETEGYFGLARLLTLIVAGEGRLKALRDHVRFLVVPCVSVYGISIKGSRENIMSDKKYEIPNNVLSLNPNRDFYNQELRETENIKKYVAERAPEIDFAFDFHTTTMSQWNAYLLPYPNDLREDVRERLVYVNRMLYELNRPSCPMGFMGPEKDYPTGCMKGTFTGGLWEIYAIPGATLEHSDYIFSDSLGTSEAMTRAVELYGNHLLCQLGY